ncbi:MAG: AhpC/TSA family protein [Tannerellaceae bacterium]|jgi:hypothetical protein|nr:AhpC/TSA family protein [Tannerellaceae bacterium]
MKRSAAVSILSSLPLIFACCTGGDKFIVTGEVSDAAEGTLYLEAVGMEGVEVLDSVRLTDAGKFRFKVPRPPYPDFYRLRLNERRIHFAVDSTEEIEIRASGHTFATSYTIKGSANNEAIREISLASLDAAQSLSNLRRDIKTRKIPDSLYDASRRQIVEAYKEVALRYIYTAPQSTAAYYALFQQAEGMLLFDMYDRKDSRAFGAVATSYDLLYRDSPRARHLHNLALQSLAVTRTKRTLSLDSLNVQEVTYLDIALPDVHGATVRLSDTAPGKVVLINFTAYATDWSASLNMFLSELYAAYHANGLEIYQVSLDTDLHLWSNAAVNAPWVTVIDPQSYYSKIAALYAVRRLPAFFLLDRSGNMVKRFDRIEEAEKEIKRHL